MAKSLKERMLDRLPGSRTASDEVRARKEDEPFLQKVSGFFQEFKTEMKKVTWPGRKETAASTVVVIITVLIIVLFLGLVDYALGRIVYSVLNI
jgi:preprotein translocase subunit SecE